MIPLTYNILLIGSDGTILPWMYKHPGRTIEIPVQERFVDLNEGDFPRQKVYRRVFVRVASLFRGSIYIYAEEL